MSHQLLLPMTDHFKYHKVDNATADIYNEARSEACGWWHTQEWLYNRGVEFRAPVLKVKELFGDSNGSEVNKLYAGYCVKEEFWYFHSKKLRTRNEAYEGHPHVMLCCKLTNLHELDLVFPHKFFFRCCFPLTAQTKESILNAHIEYLKDFVEKTVCAAQITKIKKYETKDT